MRARKGMLRANGILFGSIERDLLQRRSTTPRATRINPCYPCAVRKPSVPWT